MLIFIVAVVCVQLRNETESVLRDNRSANEEANIRHQKTRRTEENEAAEDKKNK